MKKTYIGIDVAKDSFVVAYRENTITIKKAKYSSDEKGIHEFLTSLHSGCTCIMEATGAYSLKLALVLYEHHLPVSVVNPLQTKRFFQAKLKRTKTDSVDAELIAEYGERMQPGLYEPPPQFIQQLQQQRTLLKMLKRTVVAFINQAHAINSQPCADSVALSICNSGIKELQEKVSSLENEMERLVIGNCPQLFTLLQTIPAISKKSAMELIIVSRMFKNFASAKQFSSFIGICPCINESGSSVRGYKGISRVGDGYVRGQLYMCALTAMRYNCQCKELYTRMVEAGKPKKVALVAVTNKLLKQVFGVVQSGHPYSAEYNPRKPTH